MLNKLPDWVQMLIAVGTLLFTLGFAWSNLKADMRVETTERKAADQLIDAKQQEYNKSIEDIKKLFEDELNRHHPRH